MAKTIQFLKLNWMTLFLLIIILFLGNRLRNYSYASVPNPGESADEYSFGWLGLSLIQEGYPIAWTGITAYENPNFQKINVDNIFDNHPERPAFPIVKPWFDHPPLFGLVSGGYAYFKGIRDFKDASVIILRRPMLKIAILTTILIFTLGFLLYGKWVGLLSAFLYSTVPTTVISSRLALAENAFVPLLLISLVFSKIYLANQKAIYWYLASVGAAIAILFKLSAISLVLTLFLIALFYGAQKKKFMIEACLLSLLLAFLALFAYGAYFNLSIFLKVLVTHSSRFYGAGSEVFFQAVNNFKITANKSLTDGWILAGWISFLLLSYSGWKRRPSDSIITIAVFSYLIIFLLFGSEAYGWYRFPFYPFIIISCARIFVNLIKSPNLLLFFSLILLPLGTGIHRLVGVVGFQEYVSLFRLLTMVILGLFAISALKPKKSLFWQRLFIVLTVAFTIWLSIKEIYYYGINNWYFVT